MLLNVFEDVVLRVYSRINNYEFIKQTFNILKKWAEEKKLASPVYPVL
jgi:hypothetical protein